MNYELYKSFIEEKLPQESPQMFGMHPNAEIGYLTAQCEQLFNTILEVKGGGSSGGSKKEDGVMSILQSIRSKATTEYNMLIIEERIKGETKTPFQVVCL